jgi:2-polyprenyl-6-hydroxyphenyl methylase/3-demethylubiquinone-9 3-methyltransferase
VILWGQNLPDELLTAAERDELARWDASLPPPVEDIWQCMDDAWGSAIHDASSIGAFYRHPIWLVNGVFTAVDAISCSHRQAIAAWVASRPCRRIADVGGGLGALAQTIVQQADSVEVEIVEPFVHPIAHARCAQAPRVRYVDSLAGDYDVVIAQDVLEHVDDPIALVLEAANAIRPGGFAIFANCFFPVIKCHLPQTFHLRHTFRWVAAPLRITFVERIRGAEHALVFQRSEGSPDLAAARRRERISRLFGPPVNGLHALLVDLYMKIRRWQG